jgi:hypothetical protein
MHSYSELVGRCAAFTLDSLNEVNEKTMEALQKSRSTNLVKTLQMINLQKTIIAIGMFTLFEGILQDILKSEHGFKEVKAFLKTQDQDVVLEKFIDLELAINTLKHGRGRSYNNLITKNGGTIKNYIRELNQKVQFEDNDEDISDVNTLIEVNDTFVYECTSIISLISTLLKKVNPSLNL